MQHRGDPETDDGRIADIVRPATGRIAGPRPRGSPAASASARHVNTHRDRDVAITLRRETHAAPLA